MSFPSHYRILLLVSVLIGLSLLDLRKPAGDRTRIHQYGSILWLGLIGLLFGLLTDTITSSISPDYFVWAKGIPYDERFLLQVWWFGGQAGFAAFVFLGVILMVVNPLKPNMRPILQRIWIPLVLAIGFAMVCGVLQGIGLFPRPMSVPFVDQKILNRFHIVWAIHTGLYMGGVIGIFILWFVLSKSYRQKR